ncbi:putative LOV domain-containing protein [Haematococcus lacustris]|uniref:non-specific serine/threonine protein kinase n=1 Tax=Haematococcus lacustris TaxID=44745 RepID=A0A699Z498_HAELA|nr:putative LOV domain-containing protein [Haematococcus lacustris]
MAGVQLPSAASQLTKVLAGLRHTFVVADATLPDMPLIYASDGCRIVDEVTTTVESAEPGRAQGAKGSAPKSFPRVALDLATTVERIQQNFCISDPTLPDCPIVFASDAFLDLTEYKREEVLGRNCRFLQGPGTDQNTVQMIRDAIRTGAEITVRILNYTKSGRPFWNMFTLAPMSDSDGTTRFFVGVQVDVTAVQPGAPLASSKPTAADEANVKRGVQAANMIGTALQGMGYAEANPWASLPSAVMKRKPHKTEDKAFLALLAVQARDGKLKLMHFRRVKQLGAGDVGLVDLVQLQGTEHKFAMKTLDKYEMQDRNKVQRVLTEERILTAVDHPFLPTLYCTIQTDTHLHFVMEFCDGGELYGLLNSQPKKRLREAHVRFYVAEVLLALQYLHLLGYVYRDLKPENILLQHSGHVLLTDFDLSYGKGVTTPQAARAAQEAGWGSRVRGCRRHSSLTWPVAKQGWGGSWVGPQGRGFPAKPVVSPECQDLITQLLVKDPAKRLGTRTGAEEIKAHPFFKGITWSLLRHEAPPYIPHRQSKTMTASGTDA